MKKVKESSDSSDDDSEEESEEEPSKTPQKRVSSDNSFSYVMFLRLICSIFFWCYSNIYFILAKQARDVEMVDAASSGKKTVFKLNLLLYSFLLWMPVVWCFMWQFCSPILQLHQMQRAAQILFLWGTWRTVLPELMCMCSFSFNICSYLFLPF